MLTDAHKMANLMTPINDPKWCEIEPIYPIIASGMSMHPFRATTFTISHLKFFVHTSPYAPSPMSSLYIVYYIVKFGQFRDDVCFLRNLTFFLIISVDFKTDQVYANPL